MDEKKLLRSNLHYKTSSNKLSQNNIIKINELIQNKIVCTYIPLKLEININSELKGYKELLKDRTLIFTQKRFDKESYDYYVQKINAQ